MKRFKNPLVYINPEREPGPAIRRVVHLARRNHSSVTLLAVVPDPPWYARWTGRSWSEMVEADSEALKKRMADWSKPLADDGLTVACRVETGRPFLAVVRAVLRDGHDLIIKTAEGGARVRDVLFGTTATHLLRKAPCPVWVLDPNGPASYRRILVAIDPDPENPEGLALTRKLLEMSTSLAEREGAELHVLHVWRVPFEGSLRRYGTQSEIDAARAESRLRAQQAVTEAIADFAEAIPEDRVHLAEGEPEWMISEFAAKNEVDLLVIGTVARTGIQGLLIGNVAEAVTNQAPCSLLAVKPDGFESPVTLDDRVA